MGDVTAYHLVLASPGCSRYARQLKATGKSREGIRCVTRCPVMQVEIWSDVVCPWCYLGKRRFEQGLAAFEHRDEVEVVYRSFELDPTAPTDATEPTIDLLASKYGM